MCIRDRSNYNRNYRRDDYKPTTSHTVNRPSTQHMVNKSAVNYARQPTTQQAECSEQVERRRQQDNRGEKGGSIWPGLKKRFPKPYERGVNTVKMNNRSKKECIEEAANTPSTSKQ